MSEYMGLEDVGWGLVLGFVLWLISFVTILEVLISKYDAADKYSCKIY